LELKENSRQIRSNLVDLQVKRKCLLHGLEKWSRLSDMARRNRQGSEVLARKYPGSMRGEATKLKSFYRRVDARLQHEKADIESQLLANDGKIEKVKDEGRGCRAAQQEKYEEYTLLRNKIANCQEHQRHCLFARTLWQPTPCGV